MVGCVATTEYHVDAQSVTGKLYRVTLTPVGEPKWGYYNGFDLVVENTGTKDIELNWNRTLYLKNGQTNGGFMYEGIVYTQRNDPKPPDLIFAGTSLRKRIYPNVLVGLHDDGMKTQWFHGMFRAGRHGASLSLWIDGKVAQLPQ